MPDSFLLRLEWLEISQFMGFLTILVRVLSFQPVNFPHVELSERLAKPRLAALVLIDCVYTYPLTLPERFYISLFFGRASNPVRVAPRLGIQFQKRVFIAFKQAAFTRDGVV